MKKFFLESTKEMSLSELKTEKISIKRIETNSTIHSLLCPIHVQYTDPSTKAGRGYYLHASPYYSNTKPGIMTDKPMDEIITSCKNTMLSVSDMNLDHFVFTLFYEELEDLVDELIVYVNTQSEGRTYSLNPLSKSHIQKIFPNARLARQIYASFENEQMYEMQHGDIRKQFAVALTGLTKKDLFRIGQVTFVNPATNMKISSISFESFDI